MSGDAIEALFGPLVPAGPLRRLLVIGFEALDVNEQAAQVDLLQDAQRMFIGACYQAALESDRVEVACPDTPDDLLNDDLLTVRFRKDPPGA